MLPARTPHHRDAATARRPLPRAARFPARPANGRPRRGATAASGSPLRSLDALLLSRLRRAPFVADHVRDDSVEVERRLPPNRVLDLPYRGLTVERVFDALVVHALIRNEGELGVAARRLLHSPGE